MRGFLGRLSHERAAKRCQPLLESMRYLSEVLSFRGPQQETLPDSLLLVFPKIPNTPLSP
jgi:hypothetical protein